MPHARQRARARSSSSSNGYLEKVEDFDYEGRTVLASRLGYRITAPSSTASSAASSKCPTPCFPKNCLRPEKQDLDVFVDGMDSIVEAQRRVALNYFEDGSVDAACPPLQALLHIMAHGHYEGMTVHDPDMRGMFTREALLASDWYKERLRVNNSAISLSGPVTCGPRFRSRPRGSRACQFSGLPG